MSYIGFYVVAIFEIAINIVVSSNWKSVTFKGTHLVQRLSLLTLIILGEGVMTLIERVTTVRQTYDNMTLYLTNYRSYRKITPGIVLSSEHLQLLFQLS